MIEREDRKRISKLRPNHYMGNLNKNNLEVKNLKYQIYTP